MNDTPLSIAETRETFIREDGSSYTRSDIFVKLSVTFRDKMLRKLKGPMLSIFLCISLHCNSEMESWPSISTIEEETGYSRQATIDAIKKLAEMGLIERHTRTNQKGDADSNLYRVRGFFSMGNEGVVNEVDHGWSTTLTTVVNEVDPKKIPSKKNHSEEEEKDGAPSAQPPDFLPEQFTLSVKAIQERKHIRAEWEAIRAAEESRGTAARKSLLEFIDKKLSPNAHPAVQAYREATHYYPPAGWGDKIAARVWENGNLELWTNICTTWVGLGFNPRNVKGMLDCLDRGELPDTRSTRPASTKPPAPSSTADEAFRVGLAERIEKMKARTTQWTTPPQS